ncbi:MAG: hypothetical protein ACLT98_01110 [Eggerthellaceae bacterium]
MRACRPSRRRKQGFRVDGEQAETKTSVDPIAENNGLATVTISHMGTIQSNERAVRPKPRVTHEVANAPANEISTYTGCIAAIENTRAHAKKTNATAG